MSIFGKKPDNEAATPAAAAPAPAPPPKRQSAPAPAAAGSSEGRSYLGDGCQFVGDLSGAGSFECGGDFDGTIDITGDVVIAHSGTVKAQLKARRISIEGRLQGDATGSEKVEVGVSGHVEGDVRAPAVQFAEGAFFEGNVEMRRPEEEEAAPTLGENQGGDAGR